MNIEPENKIQIGRFQFGAPAVLRFAFFATALAYVQTITYGFVFDDPLQIHMNPWVQSWHFWRSYFMGDVWSFAGQHARRLYYRPLFSVWLATNFSLFSLTPGWWHLASVAAHVTATALVYFLAVRLLRDRLTSALAALLFGVTPLHIEAVSWISAVPEVLLVIFVLGTVLAYARWRESSRPIWLALSLLSCVSALLSKETAVVTPAILAAYSWFYDGTDGPRLKRARTVTLLALPYAVLSAAYLVARHFALDEVFHTASGPSFSTVMLTWPAALLFYLRQLLWPFRLAIFYDFDLVTAFSWTRLVLPMAVLAAMALLWFYGARRSKLLAFSAIWIVVSLAPPLAGIKVFPQYDSVHDRYLYLASVMVAILIAAALKQAAILLSHSRPVAWQLAASLTLGFALLASTLYQNPQWASDLALFREAHLRAPDNWLAHDSYLRALAGTGKSDEALAGYRELLARRPDSYSVNFIYGMLNYEVSRFDEAERYFNRATHLKPPNPDEPESALFYYLGLLRQRRGDHSGAEAALREAIRIRPDALGYHLALAKVLTDEGRDGEAQQEMETERANRRSYEKRMKQFSQFIRDRAG